mmetsp:Transcript_135188/g.376648  ORF Transcript_135188/g.376648 Transcript_135188/m.376648 type:complete len:245 (-) Transcript_135188:87-821(-)
MARDPGVQTVRARVQVLRDALLPGSPACGSGPRCAATAACTGAGHWGRPRARDRRCHGAERRGTGQRAHRGVGQPRRRHGQLRQVGQLGQRRLRAVVGQFGQLEATVKQRLLVFSAANHTLDKGILIHASKAIAQAVGKPPHPVSAITPEVVGQRLQVLEACRQGLPDGPHVLLVLHELRCPEHECRILRLLSFPALEIPCFALRGQNGPRHLQVRRLRHFSSRHAQLFALNAKLAELLLKPLA